MKSACLMLKKTLIIHYTFKHSQQPCLAMVSYSKDLHLEAVLESRNDPLILTCCTHIAKAMLLNSLDSHC